jgi:hypothetical protein
MPRRPDLDAVLAALPAAEAATVAGWLDALDVDPEAVPGLGLVLTAVAATRLAADVRRAVPGTSATEAFNRASSMLGADGESIGRTLRNWRARTRQARSDAELARARAYVLDVPTARPREVAVMSGCTPEQAERVVAETLSERPRIVA